MKKLLLIALAASCASAPAYAQEGSGLGGFKLGTVVGYDNVKLSFDGESGSDDGIAYGFVAGYDFDLGSALIGIEGEIADSSTKETVTDIDVAGDEGSISAGRDLYIGARVGVPLTSSWLLYAKGGYTNARVKLRYDDGTDVTRFADNLDGYRLGAGVEYVGGQLFGRVEYRYSDYGEYSYAGFNTGLSTSRHQVVAAAGYRF